MKIFLGVNMAKTLLRFLIYLARNLMNTANPYQTPREGMMSEYKDIVGIVKFQDGTYDCYPDSAGVPPSIDYIKLEIAESLYDALKMACMRDPGWELHAQAAIEAYRKAKGE